MKPALLFILSKSNLDCKMKIHHLLFPLWMGIIICSVSACADKNKKSSEEQTQTEFEQTLEAKDTIAVKELIDQFFTYVKKQADGRSHSYAIS